MSIEETQLSYGQIFKYEFHKADGRTIDDDYEIAAKAVISEFTRRRFCGDHGLNLPTNEEIASCIYNSLPGRKFDTIDNESKVEWLEAASRLAQMIKDCQ